jgi:hypothetical protein
VVPFSPPVPLPTSSWVPLALASSVSSWLPSLYKRETTQILWDRSILIRRGLQRNMFSGETSQAIAHGPHAFFSFV